MDGRLQRAGAKLVLPLLVVALAACQTSALGRRQLKLLPESELSAMGATAFTEISAQTPTSSDSSATAMVVCVANAVTGALTGPDARTVWEVRVFDDATPNAFALPGGKIGVNTGLLGVARSQGQLAAVIGHEVSHVLAGHSNERMSAALTTQVALNAVAAIADPANPMHGQLMGVLGAGAQYGVLLPYGRAHEREADLMGLDLMARAGFDPRESVALWRNMAATGGAQPPEFLSTHPSHASRIQDLEQRIPSAMGLFEDAAAHGRRPSCS
jgi:predicted Zn-dependent protease